MLAGGTLHHSVLILHVVNVDLITALLLKDEATLVAAVVVRMSPSEKRNEFSKLYSFFGKVGAVNLRKFPYLKWASISSYE